MTSARDMNILCISGGGSGGAFTAGILSAWTKSGSRPSFDLVTGVSTGALIAPFAFLGPRYDEDIRRLYTSDKAQKLIDFNWQAGVVFGTSLLRGQVLRSLVETYITEDFLRKIAIEHRKGRRLLIMTTNLDTQRGVVWNMGAIAASGRPDALELFRNVMIASGSIPGVFPAVMIKVKTQDRSFEEMHSDGGSSAQFLAFPDEVLGSSRRLPKSMKAQKTHLFVIVNNALIPEFSVVSNRIISVAARAYAVLVKSQTKQGLLALYNYAHRAGIDFSVASIDQQVPYSMADPFNTTYMRTLYQIGLTETLEGRVWHENPVFPAAQNSVAKVASAVK